MQQQSLYPSCNTTLETEPAHLQCTIFACLCSCRRFHFLYSYTKSCCAMHNFCLCTVAIHYNICVQLYAVVLCSAKYLSVHSCRTHTSAFCKFTHTLDVCVQLPFITFLCNCSQLYCALYTVVLWVCSVHCDISRDRFLHCCSSNQHPHSLYSSSLQRSIPSNSEECG